MIWENPEWIPNNLLPFILKVAKGELEEVNVFWSDYDTIDGTWVRDYIDVVDLIEGHLKAYEMLENLEFEGFIDYYNLWVWRWVSVLEMIKFAEEVTWKKIAYKIAGKRSWDLAEIYCNPKKAENILWWKSKTNLKESLRNSWKGYIKN
jgi:UDP-glucose 4-epimerase